MRYNFFVRKNYRLILIVILVVVIGLIFFGKRQTKNTGKTPTKQNSTNTNQNQPKTNQQNNNNATGEKIYKDTLSGVTIHYNDVKESKYIKLTSWPPFVKTSTIPLTCKQIGENNTSGTLKHLETINDQVYCITTMTQSVNGTTYIQYIYETSLSGKTVTASFSVGMPLCINYAANEKTPCNQQQREFYDNMNNTIDTIVKSSEF